MNIHPLAWKSTLVVFAAAAVCLAYAYFIEPSRLVVNQYEMRVKGWDPAFDGFRVALVSDIHGGSNGVTAEYLRGLVEMVNDTDVDAVFLLGDYISRDPSDHSQLRMAPAEVVRSLAGMRARNGVFVVLGNHDEAYAADELIREFERTGYRVLNGKLAEVVLNSGEKLRIYGLQDHTNIGIWKNFSGNAKRDLVPTDGTGDLIVLQHSPDVVPVVTGELLISPDLKIMFAGHTHGGQVWLPILGRPVVPSMFGQKFAAGHVRSDGIDVFVTTGVGTSILPFRFLVPPEIAVVTIRTKE
ncbi:MAG: metallophosphoesterase [Chloracidobacterium sp.]|nr:metallophosphoesterase [Chloracidobacterium sp.]